MMVVDTVLKETIESYRSNPIDLLGINDAEGENYYIARETHAYKRTLTDVLACFPQKGNIKILEIGSFLGIVSITLAQLGFSVTASDDPIFINNPNLQQRYHAHHIEILPHDLKQTKFPAADESYDLVIMCETLEHLNFNPLPLLSEINRILKPNGKLYLSLPNLASLKKRVSLLFGKSINDPLEFYFQQLDKNENMVNSSHWREYTTDEVNLMLERLGFQIHKQYYFYGHLGFNKKASLLNALKNVTVKTIYTLFPATRPNQTTIAEKQKYMHPDFHFWKMSS
ncbi:class I SAM-dependent methyltransferase [Deltaproteobacteria bacterium TL4]